MQNSFMGGDMGTKYAPWPWFGNREGEEVGNDRLIAASPRMHKALSDLIGAINETYFDDVQWEGLEQHWKAASDVLEEINREV